MYWGGVIVFEKIVWVRCVDVVCGENIGSCWLLVFGKSFSVGVGVIIGRYCKVIVFGSK